MTTGARAHAILSASGAHRWMVCTPSAQLEEQYPDSTSEYAEEGTFAHSLAEHELRYWLATTSKDGLTQKEKRAFAAERDRLMKNQYYSQDMGEPIARYLDLVIERINVALAETPDATILLEQRLDYSRWVPGGFGTGDVVIVGDGAVEVIDLKYGQGVPVSVVDNPQLRLYGLGAYDRSSMLYDIETVRMTICQPRLDSVSTEELPADELVAWGHRVIKPAADLAWEGKGEYQAGEHCRFCRARFDCRARAETQLQLALFEFADPPTLGNDEIAEILTRADQLHRWVKDIREFALVQARDHDGVFPGWKIVEGRSTRKYADEEKAAKALLEAGYEAEQIYQTRLLGITDMSRLLRTKPFREVLEEPGHVIKPEGKATLVPESDKRPALNRTTPAQIDFAD